ncbi:MAG: hypothetical protein ACD_79C00912G0005 [uncultured bacterium]|nr:MAG: hypothetical protein ACD_79C00912G0005 [uncultured bacterium]
MNNSKEYNEITAGEILQKFNKKKILFVFILIFFSIGMISYLYLSPKNFEFIQLLTPPSTELMDIETFMRYLQITIIPKFPAYKVGISACENNKVKISIITYLKNQSSLIKTLEDGFQNLRSDFSNQIDKKNKLLEFNNNIINKLKIYESKHKKNIEFLEQYEKIDNLKDKNEPNLIKVNIETIKINLFNQKIYLNNLINDNARIKNTNFKKSASITQEINKLIPGTANFSVYTDLRVSKEVKRSLLHSSIIFLFAPCLSIFLMFLIETLSIKDE